MEAHGTTPAAMQGHGGEGRHAARVAAAAQGNGDAWQRLQLRGGAGERPQRRTARGHGRARLRPQ